MKYDHLADCHLGSWSRKPELQELNIRSFEYAIDKCITEQVSFVIAAGDFFDISFPTNTSVLSRVFAKMRELKEKNIPLYIIPGSHDFSPSGESMLKVCESAGFCINLMNLLEFDDDGKAKLSLYKDYERNVILTGILGKRIGLEVDIIKNLNKKEIEEQCKKENCLKIFIVHTAITELLPKELKNTHIEMVSCKELPKGFHYYAAGHIHEPKIVNEDGKIVAYSGCLFPNNFTELSSIQQGSFIIAKFDEEKGKIDLKEEKIKLREVLPVEIDAEGKAAKEVETEIISRLNTSDLDGKILTLKVSGELKNGRVSDINFENIYKLIYEKRCFSFLRNTHGLSTKTLTIEVSKAESVDEIEKEIIENSLRNSKGDERAKKEKLILSLLKSLDKEKAEDEKKDSFSSRLINEIVKSLNLGGKFS